MIGFLSRSLLQGLCRWSVLKVLCSWRPLIRVDTLPILVCRTQTLVFTMFLVPWCVTLALRQLPLGNHINMYISMHMYIVSSAYAFKYAFYLFFFFIIAGLNILCCFWDTCLYSPCKLRYILLDGREKEQQIHKGIKIVLRMRIFTKHGM